MADNVTADPGSGGATFRTDDDGAAHWPYTKLAWGADNTQTIVTAAAGVPVAQETGASFTVINAGTFVVQEDGAALTALQIMDDWDESDRCKSNIIVGQAGIAGGTGVDGATVPRVTLATDIALPAGTNAIGKLAANTGVDIGDVDILSIAAGDNNIGNVDIVTVPAPLSTTGGGTEAAALRVTVANDSTGVLTVDIAAAQTLATVTTVGTVTTITNDVNIADGGNTITVDNGGTFAVQAGQAAQGAAVTGSPVTVAGEGRTTEGTAVDSGDVVRPFHDIVGKVVMQPFAPSDLFQMGQATCTSTVTNQELYAAAGAGVKNYLSDFSIVNDSATDTELIFKDGGTEIWRVSAPAAGGAVLSLGTPLFTTANTALNVATVDAVDTVRVSGSGYTGR